MPKITKASVAWDGLLSNLERALKDWSPDGFAKETDYRDSLLAHLRECAPDARIEREYRHIGTTIDILFEWQGIISKDHVFIELKRNLSHKAQLDRLVGQIESLEPGKNNIAVVLCGSTDAALLERLRARYKTQTDRLTGSMLIFERTSIARAKAKA